LIITILGFYIWIGKLLKMRMKIGKRKEKGFLHLDLERVISREKWEKRGMLKQLGFSNEIRVAEIPLFFSIDWFCFYFSRVSRGVFWLRKGWYLWDEKVSEFNGHQLACVTCLLPPHVLSRLLEVGKVILILIKLILLTANQYFIF